MTQSQVLTFALEYCYSKIVGTTTAEKYGDITKFCLHRSLQYRLCMAIEGLKKSFNEVTRKDVALLIEAWVMAQPTTRPDRPIRPITQPDGVSDYDYQYKD